MMKMAMHEEYSLFVMQSVNSIVEPHADKSLPAGWQSSLAGQSASVAVRCV